MQSNAHIIKNLAYEQVGRAIGLAIDHTSIFKTWRHHVQELGSNLGERANRLVQEHVYNQHQVEERLRNE